MRPSRAAARWLPLALAAAAALALALAAPASAAWCIARSSAPASTLQAALDYACGPGGGADCAPVQSNGLCFLPNTVAAHASYAFNSIYQRAGAAPGACDFAGTATITLTDPSYGSCTYPSSPSTAGGSSGTPGTPPAPPAMLSPGGSGGGSGLGLGGSSIGFGSGGSHAGACLGSSLFLLLLASCCYLFLLLF